VTLGAATQLERLVAAVGFAQTTRRRADAPQVFLSAFPDWETQTEKRSELMYIGLGTVVVILVIVMLVAMMRRGSHV